MTEDSISTKSDLYERELDIQRLIAQGTQRKTIFKEVAKKHRIAEKTVERQYYQIVKDLVKLSKEEPNELRIRLMARNDYIYKKSMEDAKYKTALDANMAQAKLGGLFDEQNEQLERPKVIKLLEGDFSQDLKVVGDESE